MNSKEDELSELQEQLEKYQTLLEITAGAQLERGKKHSHESGAGNEADLKKLYTLAIGTIYPRAVFSIDNCAHFVSHTGSEFQTNDSAQLMQKLTDWIVHVKQSPSQPICQSSFPPENAFTNSSAITAEAQTKPADISIKITTIPKNDPQLSGAKATTSLSQTLDTIKNPSAPVKKEGNRIIQSSANGQTAHGASIQPSHLALNDDILSETLLRQVLPSEKSLCPVITMKDQHMELATPSQPPMQVSAQTSQPTQVSAKSSAPAAESDVHAGERLSPKVNPKPEQTLKPKKSASQPSDQASRTGDKLPHLLSKQQETAVKLPEAAFADNHSQAHTPSTVDSRRDLSPEVAISPSEEDTYDDDFDADEDEQRKRKASFAS